MGFCCRWAIPTRGITVLSRTKAMPSQDHPECWKYPSTTEPHIGFFFLHNTNEKLKRIYVVLPG